MTNHELISELTKILPDYVFSGGNDCTTDCIFGVKQLAPRTFRDSKKNLIISNDRIIFISSEMYPNTDKNFRYAMNYTKSTIRNFRCKRWFGYELDKEFVSGRTDEILIDEIKRMFT